MDTPDDDAWLDAVADAIADGRDVDWQALEARLSPDRSGLLRELQFLSSLAAVHRVDHSRPDAGLAPVLATPETRESWGVFVQLRRIGSGTFGIVYRAYDTRLDRDVALKLLHTPAHDSRSAPAVVAEGRLLARVRHPNVITVYGADIVDGVAGVWMELLAGRTLEDEIAARGPFGAREAAVIGIDLCRALAAVHAVGLVHRDVKAQNVMREAGGRIVLMDFGAGIHMDGAAAASTTGTPLYMAPELLAGATATQATDLYALGVLLFKLVTGVFPVDAPSLDALREAHAKSDRRRLRDVRPDLPLPFIRAVEQAVEPDPVRRVRSAAALEQLLEQTLGGGADEATPRRGAVSRSRRAVMAGGLVLAVMASAVVALPSLRERLWPRPAAIRSIAVLPFGNLTGEAGREYLADGLTQLLIGNLSQIRSLRVISQTSAMAYKGSRKPLSTIASELRVDGVLEGAIGQSGDRLRIMVQLVRGDEERVWGQAYERPAADLFTVQAEIAAMVADAVKLTLTPAEREGLVARPVRVQAQEAFLRGLQRMNDARPDGLKVAATELREAVRLDPSSARAWAALSQCYLLLGTREVIAREESYRQALGAATRAIQIDDRVAEAHTQLAEVKLYHEWNWESARRAYERALELNPNNSHAMARYSLFLSALARSGDAIRYATLAQDLDPLSPAVRFAPGMAFFYARRYNEAVEAFRRLAEVPPYALTESDRFGLGRAYAHSGDRARAVEEISMAVKLGGRLGPWVAELARLHAEAGETAEARRLLRELEERPQVAAANVAFVLLALGDRDEAFRWLGRAVQQRAGILLWARVDPRLDSVRDDSRYQALVASIGIPQ